MCQVAARVVCLFSVRAVPMQGRDLGGDAPEAGGDGVDLHLLDVALGVGVQ